MNSTNGIKSHFTFAWIYYPCSLFLLLFCYNNIDTLIIFSQANGELNLCSSPNPQQKI